MLRRFSAAALFVGGLAGAFVPLLHPGHGHGYYTHPLTTASHLLLFGAVLTVSVGLPGLFAFGTNGRGPALLGTAALFAGLWCLDGSHGLIDGAVLPVLAATQPSVAALLAPGQASQDLLASGPLGLITTVGIGAYILGSLLLGVALVRAQHLPRPAGWMVALAWILMPPSFVFPVLRAPGVALPYLALALAGAMLARRTSTPRARTAASTPEHAAQPVAAGDGGRATLAE